MHDSLILLKRYAPTLHDCAMRNMKTAKSVMKKYDERWNSMKNALSANGIFSAKTGIFDLLWKASEKDVDAETFLAFIDRTAHDALSSINEPVRRQIENLIITMITSFGKENSEYLNHLSEIATITHLVKRGCEILAVEKEVPNGKCIDFEISREGIVYLVEIYNIEFEIEKLTNSEDLKAFLENRLIKKLYEKFAGIDRMTQPVILVSVLRGDIMSLVHFRDAFDYFKQFPIVRPSMMLAYYKNSCDGRIIYDFGPVDQFLQRVEERKKSDT